MIWEGGSANWFQSQIAWLPILAQHAGRRLVSVSYLCNGDNNTIDFTGLLWGSDKIMQEVFSVVLDTQQAL